MKNKYLRYTLIALLIIAAVVAYTQIRKKSSRPEWRTDKPSMGTIREVVTATGSINPFELVEVGTEVSGRIDKIYKDFNDRVRKGELLAKLDTEILSTNLESARLEVNKARLALNKARLDFENYQGLAAKGYAPQYDLQQAEFTYRQAEQTFNNANLALQRAEKNLRNASITSPIDGVIVSREVAAGQTVAASMSSPTLFTIANNLDQMQITANVDEADIGRIKEGMPVEFSVDAYAGEQFMGFVKQIRLKSTTEQNVVSYSVIIDADNPGHKLLPGMTTNVTIITQSKENVLRIPETASRFSPSKEVWELFGLKWEDGMVNEARKQAMEKLMSSVKPPRDKRPDAGPAGKPDRADKAKTPPRGGMERSGSGGRPGSFGGGFSGRPATFGGGSGGMSMIWVLKDKTPQLIAVRTGVSDGAFVEVLSELDPELEIITGVNYKDPSQAPVNSAIQGRPGMGPRF